MLTELTMHFGLILRGNHLNLWKPAKLVTLNTEIHFYGELCVAQRLRYRLR